LTGEDSATGEWRNWPVVVAATIGASLSTIQFLSLGVMMGPIERDLGWSRAQISSGLMIVAVINVILAPVIGRLVDRLGARRIGCWGTILFSLAFACLALTRDLATWWAIWAAVAVAGALITPPVWAAGVSGFFVKSRGMAFAIVFSAAGVGALLVPSITRLLVDMLGWRGAYLGLVAGWALVTIPAVLLWFTSAADRERNASKAPPAKARSEPFPWAVMASSRFIRLALAAIALVTIHAALLANYVPILTDDGHSAKTAAALAGLLGLGSIVGRVSGGYLLDRINAGLVGGVSVLMPAITCALLLTMPHSVIGAGAAILIMGIATGVEYDAVAYLASRHFGLRHFGTLFGTIVGLLMLMNGISPFVTNIIYDMTGSYRPALMLFIPLSLISSLLFLTLGPYPSDDR
jgi:MFS family permease